jgi:hypothetical protein
VTVKVIQWATGNTGILALEAVVDAPDLELVGVRVYDDDKRGRDAGDLLGRPPVGVVATSDSDEILATDADAVLYMGSVERNRDSCFADVESLLASGKNVVATGSSFIDPRAFDPDLGDQLADACERGSSTFLGVGIFPGFWGESVAPLLSRLSFRCSRVAVRETLSYAHYPSRELMFDLMGYGYAPDDPTPALSDPSRVGGGFVGTITVLAKALGLTVRSTTPFRDTAITTKRLEVAAGVIEPGTVAAMRMGLRADCGPVELVVEHLTRMDDEIAPDWPRKEGYELEFDGEPSMRCHLELGIHGEEHSLMGCRATAMHAVHAIPAVVAAPPGLLDLGDFTAFAVDDRARRG